MSPAPPRPDVSRERRRRIARITSIGGVLIAPAIAFLVPFFGVAVSVATPFMALSLGPRVWRASRARCGLAGVVALAAIWVPAVVAASWRGSPALEYRLIPLCAPQGLAATVLVPTVAICAYLAVSAASIYKRSVWLWAIAVLVGSVTFEWGWALIEDGVRWVC